MLVEGGVLVRDETARIWRVARPRVAALLLGAACIAWAPATRAGWGGFALAVAIAGVAASSLRLFLAEVPHPEYEYLLSPPARAGALALHALRAPPWEEIAVAALVLLEVVHAARPWHTAALGAAMIAYLLAVHVAESGAAPGRLLRGQARTLIAGACLLAISAAAAMLPLAGPGSGSALLRLLAAAAVVSAAALILPA